MTIFRSEEWRRFSAEVTRHMAHCACLAWGKRHER